MTHLCESSPLQRYAQCLTFSASLGGDAKSIRSSLIHHYVVPLPLLGEGYATRKIRYFLLLSVKKISLQFTVMNFAYAKCYDMSASL